MFESQTDLGDQENILYSARNGDVEGLQKLLLARAEGEIKLDVSCKGITYHLLFVLKEYLCFDNIQEQTLESKQVTLKTSTETLKNKLLIAASSF